MFLSVVVKPLKLHCRKQKKSWK